MAECELVQSKLRRWFYHPDQDLSAGGFLKHIDMNFLFSEYKCTESVISTDTLFLTGVNFSLSLPQGECVGEDERQVPCNTQTCPGLL